MCLEKKKKMVQTKKYLTIMGYKEFRKIFSGLSKIRIKANSDQF